MRKVLRRPAILLFLWAALTAAKKSSPPNPAYDPAANFAVPRTYAWLEGPAGSRPEGNSIVDAQFVDRHVRAAVEASLGRKGFTKVAKDPSFYVAYREDSAGGMSQNGWDLPPKYAIDEPWLQVGELKQPTPNPAFVPDSGTNYRKRSTLVLDILDSRKKLIWRGSRTSSTGTNPEELAKGIDHAVARLLAQFPPKTHKVAK